MVFYKIAEYILADSQSECSEMEIPLEKTHIVDVNTPEGCQDAVNNLNVDNPDVFIEDQPSVPKGCYVYLPENKLYFNQHITGLEKEEWSDDTRRVCHDLDMMLEVAGGILLIVNNSEQIVQIFVIIDFMRDFTYFACY